uniref:Uncharacterized protein n=1 Tax=Molossus molossus TaxID=27622 RepID=A0A7J8EEW7_MOLMO|nr:hypothetical protein HJG59_008796 [Molossus molossus]
MSCRPPVHRLPSEPHCPPVRASGVVLWAPSSPNPSAPVPCTHSVLAVPSARRRARSSQLLSCLPLYPLTAQPGPLNRGAPWTEAPTVVEWIFVLNERDPEIPSNRLGCWASQSPPPRGCCLLLPTSRQHPSLPLEDLREEGVLPFVSSFSHREKGGRAHSPAHLPGRNGEEQQPAPLDQLLPKGRKGGWQVYLRDIAWWPSSSVAAAATATVAEAHDLGWEGTPVTSGT